MTNSAPYTTDTLDQDFFVTGGTMPPCAPSYVNRRADAELYTNLTQGKFCYVLTARQVGKSSLMVRTAARLRDEGVAVAVLDLTASGQNLDAEQWYYGMLGRIGEQLDLEDELDDYWLANTRMGSLQRWMSALREVVLARREGKVVIFIDEVDLVLSLPFKMDEFFGGIREIYNRRSEDPELNRLTFCLLGAATPSDLMKDNRLAPFNIGERIELTDFDENEVTPLMEGIAGSSERGSELIKRVLYWTGGHPFLTQCLCRAISEQAGLNGSSSVDQICEKMFLSPHAREQNDNLQFVSKRILENGANTAELLTTYAQVHMYECAYKGNFSARRFRRKKDCVKAEDTNPFFVSVLQISGIVKIVEKCLHIRNEIYRRVFNRQWVEDNMPQADFERRIREYREKWRKKLLRIGVIGGLIMLITGGAAVYAVIQRDLARAALQEATKQREAAESAQKVAEEALATSEKQREEIQTQHTRMQEAQGTAAYRSWQADLMTWQMIMNDTNPWTFKTYLDVYGEKAEFAEKAKKKLKALQASPPPAEGVPDQGKGVIRGRVYDLGIEGAKEGAKEGAIAGATIMAKGADVELIMFSNLAGEFMLPLLPTGSYTITISAKGYVSAEGSEKQVITGFLVEKDKVNWIKPKFSGLKKVSTHSRS